MTGRVSAPADVVCAGTAGIDILVKGLPAEALFRQEMLPADQVQLSSGGDPMNEAVILRRLGKSVRFCSKVGRDVPGELLLHLCEKEGIDTSFVKVCPEESSAATLVLISEDGERSFVSNMFHVKNITSTFSVQDVDPAALAGAKVFSFGSLFINPGIDAHALEALFSLAKGAGCLVCADMVANAPHDAMEGLRGALSQVDFLFPNRDEGAYFSGESDPDAICDYFLALGVKHVVLKLGKDGCLIKSRDARIAVPIFPAPTVDTTGAGDSFAGGFICALTEGKSLAECGVFASAVASLVVRAVGANAGLTDRAQVEALLRTENQ